MLRTRSIATPRSSEADTLVVAALSGGVDSATAAGLLVEQGRRVVGMTMRLHDSGPAAEGRCCGPRDLEDARAVCAHLGIPHHVIDLSAEFTAAVVENFIEAYLAGETPNPCVKCNQHIKFTPLLARARAVGADLLVTGHYARIADHGLYRGRDAGKDQSYFLFSMPGDELGAVQFPLGGMTKDEVRAHAERLGLPNARKAESQEICFVPDGDHAGFVARAAVTRRPKPGAIVDEAGAVVGRHDGVHRFTVGQHRGLGNLATTKPGDKLFVTAIDPDRAEVRVGPRASAERTELAIHDIRWLSEPRTALSGHVQVRHRGQPIASEIRTSSDYRTAHVRLSEPVVAAPGHAAVIYDRDRVLAGGWIARG